MTPDTPSGRPPRLTAKVEVSSLIRRIQAAGGYGMVIARGDPDAGAILLWLADRGRFVTLAERVMGPDGYGWRRVGPQDVDDNQSVDNYIGRRRAVDGDIWVIELDIAGVERFAAETVGMG